MTHFKICHWKLVVNGLSILDDCLKSCQRETEKMTRFKRVIFSVPLWQFFSYSWQFSPFSLTIFSFILTKRNMPAELCFYIHLRITSNAKFSASVTLVILSIGFGKSLWLLKFFLLKNFVLGFTPESIDISLKL